MNRSDIAFGIQIDNRAKYAKMHFLPAFFLCLSISSLSLFSKYCPFSPHANIYIYKAFQVNSNNWSEAELQQIQYAFLCALKMQNIIHTCLICKVNLIKKDINNKRKGNWTRGKERSKIHTRTSKFATISLCILNGADLYALKVLYYLCIGN